MLNWWRQVFSMRISLLASVFTACSIAALHAGERIELMGTVIRYDGNVAYADGDDAFSQDANAIRELVRGNPNISKIVLVGDFPMTGLAIEVARVIEDFGLATEIDKECTNACLYMFASGNPRVLGDGARIGLRRRVVDAALLKKVYPKDAQRFGWADESGQAAMMYDRGQSDMRWALLHLVQHGIALDFALKIFATPREDMWWPTRGELVAGGVTLE